MPTGLRGEPDFSGPCAGSIDVDANKSDTAKLPSVVRMLEIATGGDVVFHVLNDAANRFLTRTFVAGDVYDRYYIDQVKSTGTTASGITGGV